MNASLLWPTRAVFHWVAPLAALLHLGAACATWLAIIVLSDPSAARSAEPLEPTTLYRRIHVPADNIEAWPLGGQKYLPIEARDFEAWLQAANSAALESPAKATVQEAEYSARIDGERLVDCRGQWNIAVPGESSAFLPLGDMSLVVREAHWRSDPKRPVRLGAWGKNGGPADAVGLEVPSGDTLEFLWQAPSKAIHNGIEIAWRLPPTIAARLILDLPIGKEPLLEGGIVLGRHALPPHAGQANRNLQRWELALNPSSATTLRLVDVGGAPVEPSPSLLLREKASYRITHRGLDIETTWHLDAVHDRRELAMTLPRDVRLISAAVEDRELSWRIVKDDDQFSAEVAIIELPKEVADDSLQITLRAWQPLWLDQPWQLPKLRPEAVFWQSGKVEVSVGPQLEMLALSCKDCVQTGVSQADDNATEPEASRLTMYSPTAEVNVRIARRQPQATIRLGSSLALTDPEVSGRLVTEWTVGQGSVHRLSGELAPGWIIEALEIAPAEARGEWFLDERGDRRHLEIQLARAARPGQNVTVTMTGRLQRAGIGEPIPAKSLRVVDWTNATVARHLLTFQSVEPYAVETVGDLATVAGAAVSEEDRARINRPSGKETVFDLAKASDGAGLQLTLERGQYEADIRLNAAYVQQELSGNYHLVIHPATNGVDRLLIFSTAELGDVRWTEKSLVAPLSAERLPADDSRRAGLPSSGELWLVRLPGLTTRTVEIVAAVDTPWPARKQLPLLALPEAAQQRGQVLVSADAANMPLLEPEGLQSRPLPAETAASAKTEARLPLRAAYRYDPASCLTAAGAARLWIGPGAANDTNLLVARHVELESFFWSNGWATHRVTYDLENEGAANFRLRLPEDAVVRAVLLNGQALQQPVSERPGQLSSIPLGAGTRSGTISVHFDTQQRPLSAGSRLQPPLIHNEIPILAGRWTIWLPEEFSTTVANSENRGEYFHWRRRLFGPLSRPSKETPFHPLRTTDWARLLSPLGSLSVRADEAKSDLLGWAPYRMSFVAEGPAAVWVAHPPAIGAWAIAMFLFCLVGGRWILAVGGRTFVALVASAAALALLLPAVFAPVATATVLGLLFSLVARWPRYEASGNVPSRSWSRISTVSVPSVLIALVAAKLASAEPVDTPAAPPVAAQQTIERVLIPVDSTGRQAGSKYYVSEQFLRQLVQPHAEEARQSRQWILHDAVYTGELRERAEPPGIAAGEWTVALGIEALARDTTVVLPLVRDEATWRDTAMLDGVPVPLLWREGGRGCAIEISEPGEYSLMLSGVPRIMTDSRRASVRLKIPPLGGARLKLQYPKSRTGLTVSGAGAAPLAPELPGELERELGATGQLELQWPSISLAPAGSQSLRVTSMRWLRIGVADVELQVKYAVEGSARRPEALTVAFDRRWELVTKDGSSAGGDVADEPDGRRSVRVPLLPDEIDRQEITLHWRLSGADTFGRLRLPPIELISVPVTDRWLAISTDPELECEFLDGSASPGAVNEFLAMWGDAEDVPQLVLGHLSTTVPWSLAIRPRQNESLIDEVLHVAADRDRLRVAYQADVAPGRAHEYQFQLIVPADLSIDEITLAGPDGRVPIRWARVDETHVNVFFSEQMASEYRLALRGTAPAAVGATRSLPRVTAPATNSASQTVQLYREEGVLVETTGVSDADQLRGEPREPPPAAWTVRPVGVYRLDRNASDQARLRITPNDIQLAGPTLLSLTRDADAWTAGFYGRLTVQQGRLDRLKLRAPATWPGPFTIESDVPAAIELDAADARGTTLLIRFEESIEQGKSVELRVGGPLMQTAQSPVSMPEITPEPMVRGKRYLLVPSHREGQPIAWREGGVRPSDLPNDLHPARDFPRDHRAFEVIGSAFDVAIQPPTTLQPSARVRLADTTVWAATSNDQLIETRLVIAAPELAQCILQLPTEQELVSVRLDEQPAIIQPFEAGRWRVSLGPTPLPQTLEIISLARANEDRQKLQRPLLLVKGQPMPVEFSLWSIGRLAPAGRLRIAGANTVTAAEQAAFRLDRLVGIAEASTPAAVEAPHPDGYHWFRPWADRLSSLREEAAQKMRSVAGRSLSQVSASAEEQLTRASDRLDLWIEQCNELLADRGLKKVPASGADGPVARPRESPPVSQWIYCVAEGGASVLMVDSATVTATPSQIRVVGLLAIFCSAAASVWLMRRPAAADFLYRWPHAITFLFGIVYWAWLWPSWLGILIAGGSLISAWWLGWPGRSLSMERSTVLRVSRSDVVAP